jgi:hypothetical protein
VHASSSFVLARSDRRDEAIFWLVEDYFALLAMK